MCHSSQVAPKLYDYNTETGTTTYVAKEMFCGCGDEISLEDTYLASDAPVSQEEQSALVAINVRSRNQ